MRSESGVSATDEEHADEACPGLATVLDMTGTGLVAVLDMTGTFLAAVLAFACVSAALAFAFVSAAAESNRGLPPSFGLSFGE
jgi:hypothetical protein